MSTQRKHFKWNLHVVEQIQRLLHNRQVARAAHDYTNQWFHNFLVKKNIVITIDFLLQQKACRRRIKPRREAHQPSKRIAQ